MWGGPFRRSLDQSVTPPSVRFLEGGPTVGGVDEGRSDGLGQVGVVLVWTVTSLRQYGWTLLVEDPLYPQYFHRKQKTVTIKD